MENVKPKGFVFSISLYYPFVSKSLLNHDTAKKPA